VAVYTAVDPLRTVTVPVGVPAPGETGVTVKVAVTVWPETDVAGETVTAVVVEDCFTVCVNGVEVLALNFMSPP
jgi:hypothetical protein